MLTVDQIPSEWKLALAKIQQIAPEAVIGGGALRDLDNGRPVKDVDIFVNGKHADHLEDFQEKLRDLNIVCDEFDPDKLYPVGEGNDVVGFFNAHFHEIAETQIIMVYHDCSLEKIVERFDYGICKISYDGRALYRSTDYEVDREAQLFRLCLERHDQELIASVHRYARLVQKYPGWQWRPFQKYESLFG